MESFRDSKITHGCFKMPSCLIDDALIPAINLFTSGVCGSIDVVTDGELYDEIPNARKILYGDDSDMSEFLADVNRIFKVRWLSHDVFVSVVTGKDEPLNSSYMYMLADELPNVGKDITSDAMVSVIPNKPSAPHFGPVISELLMFMTYVNAAKSDESLASGRLGHAFDPFSFIRRSSLANEINNRADEGAEYNIEDDFVTRAALYREAHFIKELMWYLAGFPAPDLMTGDVKLPWNDVSKYELSSVKQCIEMASLGYQWENGIPEDDSFAYDGGLSENDLMSLIEIVSFMYHLISNIGDAFDGRSMGSIAENCPSYDAFSRTMKPYSFPTYIQTAVDGVPIDDMLA